MNVSIIFFVIFLFFLGFLGYLVIIYNSLIRLRNNVAKTWANIDILLKQRHDEIPKLVSTAKQYMSYEKGTLEGIVTLRNSVNEARAAGDMQQLGTAEQALRNGMGKFFALAEGYPDLKANDSFQQLHQRISALEDGISDRRELYNDTVTLNNTRVEQFPDVLIARMFNFDKKPLLEFSEEAKQDVNIDALFSA